MEKLITIVCVITITFFPLISSSAEYKKEIKVGIYPFPPYVNYDSDRSGITIELLRLLNEFQHEWKFIPINVSPKRRFIYMNEKRIDILIFEDIDWGWANQNVEFSRQFYINGKPYQDADLYIALKEKGRNQSYFDNFAGKKLLLTRGYHYSFANYNANEKYLKQHFNAEIATNPKASIKKLLLKRGDIALATKSLLENYIKANPSNKDKFLICDRKDSIYEMLIVVGRHSPVSKYEIDKLLLKLEKTELLNNFFKENNLTD